MFNKDETLNPRLFILIKRTSSTMIRITLMVRERMLATFHKAGPKTKLLPFGAESAFRLKKEAGLILGV